MASVKPAAARVSGGLAIGSLVVLTAVIVGSAVIRQQPDGDAGAVAPVMGGSSVGQGLLNEEERRIVQSSADGGFAEADLLNGAERRLQATGGERERDVPASDREWQERAGGW